MKRMNAKSNMISQEVGAKKLTFDEQLLKALSSPTRIEILKNLHHRQMTLTDLSRIMKFAKSTVHEHLMRLLAAGLIHRITGRKWIYYRLSRKGNCVVGIMG
ncbi:MAG: winged helix-turn-helix transcriptional regulator [Thermoplasmata archaeon]|nr:MAG: winged helix-turn-helix transcriptional regulator [Thermoplasmata archaeon]